MRKLITPHPDTAIERGTVDVFDIPLDDDEGELTIVPMVPVEESDEEAW